MIGTRPSKIQGKIVQRITTAAKNQLNAIINVDIASVRLKSAISMSYVYRFRIRPIGVDSKYETGAFNVLATIAEKIFLAHRAPPVTFADKARHHNS